MSLFSAAVLLGKIPWRVKVTFSKHWGICSKYHPIKRNQRIADSNKRPAKLHWVYQNTQCCDAHDQSASPASRYKWLPNQPPKIALNFCNNVEKLSESYPDKDSLFRTSYPLSFFKKCGETSNVSFWSFPSHCGQHRIISSVTVSEGANLTSHRVSVDRTNLQTSEVPRPSQGFQDLR